MAACRVFKHLVSTKEYPALIERLKPSKGWPTHQDLPGGHNENLKLTLAWAIYFGDGDLVKLCISHQPELTDTEWAGGMLH